MVKFTDQAILAIQESMKKASLHMEEFALYLYLHEDNLSLTFTDDMSQSKKVGDIFVKIDAGIEQHHQNNPLVIDYVTNGEKQGLIFLEGNQYGRDNH
jgi:hypothetical protein